MSGARAALVAAATSVVLLIPTPTAHAASAAQSCLAADALLMAGDAGAAQKAYEKLMTGSSIPACAVRGLRQALAGAPPPPQAAACALGDERFEAGDLVGARRAYVRLGRDSKCAASGLAAVRDVTRLCAEGKAQLASHHKDDALKAFQAALAKNPNAECATTGVAKASEGTLSRALNSTADTLPKAAFAVALLVVLFFVILLLGHFDRVWRLLVRVPFLRALMGPRLRLEPFGDRALPENLKIGECMSSRIRERLRHYEAEALDPSRAAEDIDKAGENDEFAALVSGDSTLGSALGQVREVSEHGAFVTALLNLLYALLPIRRLSVTGTLDCGPGVTLCLQNGSRLEAATTLPMTDVPLGSHGTGDAWSDFEPLVAPAAVWIQYEVARLLTHEQVMPDDAESHVLVRMGHEEKDADKARQLYALAVARNPKNWAARVNQIALLMEGADKDAAAEAQKIADETLELMVQ